MAYPASLPSLAPREAIADTLYRTSIAFDTDDVALFDSAFTPTAILDLDGKILEGTEAIHAGCWDLISKLDTTHFVSNVRVNVKDGATTAYATSSVLAYHYRPGEARKPGATHFTGSSFYEVELVRDEDGLWKATHWKVKILWQDGDKDVMAGSGLAH